MSKNTTTVLSALAGSFESLGFAQLSASTGLTSKALSTAVFALKARGLVEIDKDAEGRKYKITAYGLVEAKKKRTAADESEQQTADSQGLSQGATESRAFNFAAWDNGEITIYRNEDGMSFQLSEDDVLRLGAFIRGTPLATQFAPVKPLPGLATLSFLMRPEVSPAPPAPPAPAGADDDNKFGHLFTPPPGPAPTEPTGLVAPNAENQ